MSEKVLRKEINNMIGRILKRRSIREKSLLLLTLLLVIGVSILVFGCSKGDAKVISIVKDGHLQAYPEKTLGEAVDDYFRNPKWEHIVGEDGNDYVNVTGGIKYHDKSVEALIQYRVSKEEDAFELQAFEINEVPQAMIMYMGLIESMYE